LIDYQTGIKVPATPRGGRDFSTQMAGTRLLGNAGMELARLHAAKKRH